MTSLLKLDHFSVTAITSSLLSCLVLRRVIKGGISLLFQENIHPFAYRYSLQNDKWKAVASMERERCNFSLIAAQGCLYAIGGDCMQAAEPNNKDSVSACECYSPDTNQWKSVQPMPGYRKEHAGAKFGHFLFVSGGLYKNIVLTSTFCYNAETDVWKQKAPLLIPRAGHVMLVMGHCLYVCGGWREDAESGNRILIDTIDVYDIITDEWKVVAKNPFPRYQGGIVGVDNKIYFIGGSESDGIFNRATGMLILFIKLDNFTAKNHISIE